MISHVKTFHRLSKIVTPRLAESLESAANAIKLVDGAGHDDVDTSKLMEVNSAVVVEKEIATGRHFLPFVEQCALELVGLLPHYYVGIRKSAMESLLGVVWCFYRMSEPADWVPGTAVVSL